MPLYDAVVVVGGCVVVVGNLSKSHCGCEGSLAQRYQLLLGQQHRFIVFHKIGSSVPAVIKTIITMCKGMDMNNSGK